MDRWRIQLLGEIRATRASWELTRFRTQKTAALLAYLAYHKDRAHAREVLIDLFWPDGSPDTGRNNLSQALSALRHQLEPPGVETGSVVLATRATIQIEPSAVTTDVAELRAALEVGQKASGASRTKALREAVDLYRGELLPNVYQDWVAVERDRLRAACGKAARELASLLRKTDVTAAVDSARRAVAIEPLGEEAHRDLLSLLADAGEPSAALKHYEELERTFEKELGHAPSLATRELVKAIAARAKLAPEKKANPETPKTEPIAPSEGVVTVVASSPAIAAAIVARHGGRTRGSSAVFARPHDAIGATLASLRSTAKIAIATGELARGVVDRAERLLAVASPGQAVCAEETAALVKRDLEAGARVTDLGVFRVEGSQERLFEVASPSAPVKAPRAERVRQGKLPLELDRIHGRDSEIAIALEELSPRKTRLLTITGPGGIGKTRLAVEVASKLEDAYRGGVFFVPLAPLPDARLVAGAIADTLGIARGPGDPLERAAAELEKISPALLVLDNFEHLMNAAEIARSLLERVKGLAVLVTSRQRLGFSGEKEIALAPLPLPEGPPDTIESLESIASVAIFVERAKAVRPGFEVTTKNANALAQIVRHLEGIPLALALAAGRTQVLTPEQILDQLPRRLDALEARNRDVPERHRTLRAAIEWSYRLLAPERRAFLSKLAVFRGGFTVEAAAAVGDETIAADAIADLRECSFLLAPEGDRFQMLETIRELALDKLSKDELEQARRKHAAFFLDLAERAVPLLSGPDQGEWLDKLEVEHANLIEALEHGEPDTALRIGGALRHYWVVRGPISPGRKFLERALERSTERNAPRVHALLGLGALAFADADPEAAKKAWEESLELAKTLGDPGITARVLNNLALLHRTKGDMARAVALLEESTELALEAGDKAFALRSLLNRAGIARTRGDLATARAHLQKVTELGDEIGEKLQGARARRMLGDVAFEQGDPTGAKLELDRALAAFEALGAKEEVGLTLHSAARIPTRAGQIDLARPMLERAVASIRESGAKSNLPVVLLGLGMTITANDPEAAKRALDEGRTLALACRDKLTTAHFEKALGDLLRANDRDGARAKYHENLRILRELGAKLHVAPTLIALASLECEQEPERAAKILGASRALNDELGWKEPGLEERTTLESLRARLGEALDGRFQEGRALATDAAIELALGG